MPEPEGPDLLGNDDVPGVPDTDDLMKDYDGIPGADDSDDDTPIPDVDLGDVLNSPEPAPQPKEEPILVGFSPEETPASTAPSGGVDLGGLGGLGDLDFNQVA